MRCPRILALRASERCYGPAVPWRTFFTPHGASTYTDLVAADAAGSRHREEDIASSCPPPSRCATYAACGRLNRAYPLRGTIEEPVSSGGSSQPIRLLASRNAVSAESKTLRCLLKGIQHISYSSVLKYSSS